MPYRDGRWRAPELQGTVDSIDTDTHLIVPRGELDVATVGTLEDAFRQQVNGGGTRIVLDLQGVPFIDSTAMAMIAEWRDKLFDAGGAFALVTVDHQHRRLFHLTELTERLRVSPTREQAIRALDEAGAGDQRADRSS